ncbi:Retrovirus-related Pol polyprotein from transposon opus [Penaeus vannamei]|uniref:Retrovirus-related Pol polyprotein from transposon opus n=1 Tax=Penaeus vannamei TaxID=6689 RepID=A0A3R7P4V9_PENVA|nr:Retrovirus-related Pol polyprotein from transposon opus [Penaeus vannamei]
MESNAATLFTEVNAASICLPPFSPNGSLTWFRRAETQFRLKNIVKATTKADHVVAVLPEEVFHRIAPWLDSQPDDIDYDTLKQELLKEFSLSPSERARQILNIPNTPLGDRTPKQVWQEITALCRLPTKDAEGKFHEVDLKKEIWLRSLRGNIREKLHDANETAIEVLLTRANTLVEAHRQARPQSAAPIFPSAGTDNNAATIPINAATARGTNTNRRPFARYLAADGICSYHKRFGNAAYHCLNGCRWKPRRRPQQRGRWPLHNPAITVNNAVNRPRHPALPHYRRQHDQPLVVPRDFFHNNNPSDTQREDLRQGARKFTASRPTRRSHHPPYTPAGRPSSPFHHDGGTYTRSGPHSRPRRILTLKSFLP